MTAVPAPHQTEGITAFAGFGLTRLVARGGMADVYRALPLQRPDAAWLAVKVMRRSVDHQELRHRLFAREVRISEHLIHPNIVRVKTSGEDCGCPYLVMEYVGGRDVASFLNQRVSVPQELVLAVGARAAAALGHAHRSASVVHRDVSPGNIRVRWDGVVKVLDFGVARLTAPEDSQTQAGVLRGKFAYMSPEQARGDAVDPRSDVFSLGIVLYELLVGRAAFRGEGPMDTLQRVRGMRLSRPSEVRSGVGADLDALMARCLAKDPAYRFADGETMAAAFDEALRERRVDGRKAWADYLGTVHAKELRREQDALLDERGWCQAGVKSSPRALAPTSTPGARLVGQSVLEPARVRSGEPPARPRLMPWLAALLVVSAALVTVWVLVRTVKDEAPAPSSDVRRLPAVPIELDTPSPGGGH